MSLTETLALFGGLAVFNLLSCLPLLFFSSTRRLFKALPAENLLLNYVLGVGGYTVIHSSLLLSITVIQDGLKGIEVLWGLGGINIGAGLLSWITASFLFPHLGWWNPEQNEEELDGRMALGLGLIWYTISTGVGLFLLMVFLIVFFFPG